MKKPDPPTLAEIEYVTHRVAEWIAAGDMIEEHATICINTVTEGYCVMRDALEQRDLSLADFCDFYHAGLKVQETMSVQEYNRKKRFVQKVRRDLASGKLKLPWDE